MATAGLNRMMLWGDLEGRQLEERWLLGRLVRPEGRTAWFEAIGPDGVPVMLSVTEALNDEDELLARLSAAADIRHPNVVAIREATISHLDDTPVVVGVMEMTEENLGDVLRERTLSAAEGRQVLDAVLAALGAMHAHGLVHKHIEAGSVLAMGETIKLRSDCVQMGGSAFGTAATDDVRAAGRMATQAVTGRYPAGENDPVLQLLPEPMARAVRRALSGNAGATEVAALAGTRLELMPEVARVEPQQKAASKTTAATEGVAMPHENAAAAVDTMKPESTSKKRGGLKAEAKASGKAPRLVAMKPADERAQAALFGESFMLPNEREIEAGWVMDPESSEGKWPGAVYVVAAAIAVVLVTVFTLYGLMHREPEQRPAAPATSAATPPAAAKAASVVTVSAAAQATTASMAGWRVIAYSFDREEEARQQARALAQRFSELNPEVFTPRSGDVWLVTLGGIMSRGEALALRDKVIDMGLPEDTYAQNFR
jgi:hypothetical protein